MRLLPAIARLLVLAAALSLGSTAQDSQAHSRWRRRSRSSSSETTGHNPRRKTRGDGFMTDGGSWPYIIIGGGLAGLAAAQQLTALYGAQNVLVLEARDRIGGRVKTVTIGSTNATIDVGASWIHGTETSPLYPIAQRLGLDVRGCTEHAWLPGLPTHVMVNDSSHFYHRWW